MTEKRLPQRSEVPDKLKWKLDDLFPDVETMANSIEASLAQAKKLHAMAGTLGENQGHNLLKALQENKQIDEDFEREFVYAMLLHDSDTTAEEGAQAYDQADRAAVEIDKQLAFLEPELISLREEDLRHWLDSIPKLQEFAYYLHEVRRLKKHVLSKQEERLLGSLGKTTDAAADIYNTLNDADLRFGQVHDEAGNLVELTDGNRTQFAQSDRRPVRKEAFLAYQRPYHRLRHTFAATLSQFIASRNTIAELRHYDSARQASLAVNDIDDSVYQVLVKTVNQHLDLAHRWYAIKKRVSGIDDFAQYDVTLPLAGKHRLKMDFNTAKQVVTDALRVLGSDYQDKLREELTHRWVDVAENRGKRSGGYEVGVYQVHPYILLNWNDELDSTYTLAHESGHAMHSWLSASHQPSQYAEAPIFLAEIASTFNENILTHYLLSKYQDNPQAQLSVLEQSINSFIGTIFRQTQFAEFEDTAYQADQAGQALTADYLDKLNRQLQAKYFGPDVRLVGTATQGWAYVPHFYMDHYVYQYATSWAIASTLAARVWNRQPGALEKYLQLLQAGSSASPLDILRNAGIVVTSSDYLTESFELLNGQLNLLEKLVKTLDN